MQINRQSQMKITWVPQWVHDTVRNNLMWTNSTDSAHKIMFSVSFYRCFESIKNWNNFPSTEPPHINGSDEPEELSVIVNNPLELLCISSGIPVPKISWMKDGRPLLQTGNIHMLREALRITSAQVECLFQNRLNSAIPKMVPSFGPSSVVS